MAILARCGFSQTNYARRKHYEQENSLAWAHREHDIQPADRPKVGARANEAKATLEGALGAKRSQFESQALTAKLDQERVDFTLPARKLPIGSLHPITKVIAEVVSIFHSASL